jgi:hypothetical protein
MPPVQSGPQLAPQTGSGPHSRVPHSGVQLSHSPPVHPLVQSAIFSSGLPQESNHQASS